MIESLTNFGYIASGVGVVLAIVAYFLLPKLIKSAFKSDLNEESPESESKDQ